MTTNKDIQKLKMSLPVASFGIFFKIALGYLTTSIEEFTLNDKKGYHNQA